MKKMIMCLFLLGIGMILKGQEFRIPESRTVKIRVNDTLICFDVSLEMPIVKQLSDRFYYWHESNRIFFNQGGWSGKLLHGKFCLFISGKLIEVGYYRYGLKNGEWKKWRTNGSLYRIEEWKEGVLHGNRFVFQEIP